MNLGEISDGTVKQQNDITNIKIDAYGDALDKSEVLNTD